MQSLSLEEKLQQRSEACERDKPFLNSVAWVSQYDEKKKEEKIILRSKKGFSDRSEFKSKPLEHDTQFLSGSVVKSFVAVALLMGILAQLQEKYKNETKSDEFFKKTIAEKELQRPLSDFIPETDPIWDGKMPSWASSVTLYQLLTHTSGLPDFWEPERWCCPSSRRKKEPSIDELRQEPNCPLHKFVSQFKNKGLPWGNQFHYANPNYLLIARVAENILHKTGKAVSLETFFSDLFKELNMRSTVFTSRTVSDLRENYPNLAVPYVISLEDKRNKPTIERELKCENMVLPWGTGSLISTAGDLTTWSYELFSQNRCIPRIVSELMQARGVLTSTDLKSNTSVYYFCGIERCERSGQVICFQFPGSISAFIVVPIFFPKNDTGVADTCVVELSSMRPSSKRSGKNLGGDSAYKFALVIGDHYYPKTKPLPRQSRCPNIFKRKTEVTVTTSKICTIL